jgi:hypothetical protein
VPAPIINKKPQSEKELTPADFPALGGSKKLSSNQQPKQSWSSVVQRALEDEKKKEEEKRIMMEKERIEQQRKKDEDEQKRIESERDHHRYTTNLPIVPCHRTHHVDEEEYEEYEDILKNYDDENDFYGPRYVEDEFEFEINPEENVTETDNLDEEDN